MPLLDVRHVTRPSGKRGLKIPASWGERSICEFCQASSFCEIRREVDPEPIPQCAVPILPLTFRDTTGLDTPIGEEFSTIRLGSAWHYRLTHNDGGLVALHKKWRTGSRFIGYAKVKFLMNTVYTTAVASSDDNHMVKDLDLPRVQKVNELGRIVKKYYGGFDKDQSRKYTVIRLERTYDIQSERLSITWPNNSLRENRSFVPPG